MSAFIGALDNDVSVSPAAGRRDPAVVRLPARAGVKPSPKPPVRIFLGTEDAQYQAERIFFYSIEQVRDPGRVYEIYLMKNLAGFNRRWWRTGFTNYRFAIPDFAGRQGKAIYNDVDQVYTADPALLFDLDMQGHGYLSISPADTSVMLIDCARMAERWNRDTASRRHKHLLTRSAAAATGLWGPLDPGWNARDTEYVEGQSMLLHFTALHLQPWQPTPDQYSYRPNPLGEVWHRLKRAADSDGYQVFTTEQPSPDYELALARQRAGGVAGGSAVPWSAVAQQRLAAFSPLDRWQISVGPRHPYDHDTHSKHFDLTRDPWPTDQAEALLASDCLERLPAEDVPWVLDALFRQARRWLYIAVHCGPSEYTLADGGNMHQCQRPPEWWQGQMLAIARHHPDIAWHLDLWTAAEPDRPLIACLSRTAEQRAPRVLLLQEDEPATDAAGRRLAETLDWPWEECPAVDAAAMPPAGVDLVLTSGRQGLDAVRQWRRRGGAVPRLAHLGRPSGDLSEPDLVIIRPQDQLPLRSNVLYLPAPMSPVDSRTLERAAAQLRPALASLPRPWIGLLLGGGDMPSALDRESARELGRLAAAEASAQGGALIVAPYPGTPAAAIDALTAACDCHVYCPRPDGDELLAVYHGCIALAERFIVTSDSADAMAAACAGDRPAAVFELAPSFPPGSRWAQRWQVLLDSSIRHKSHRGTPRQQDWRGRLYDWLITSGRLTSTHDPRPLLQACLLSGRLTRLGGESTDPPRAPALPSPVPLIRQRIHQLLSFQCI